MKNEVEKIIYSKFSKEEKIKKICKMIEYYLKDGREDIAAELAGAFKKIEEFEKNKEKYSKNGWL